MSENSRGFHHRAQQNFARGGGGSSGGPSGGLPKRGMTEPTNHAGHTHDVARRRDSDARIASIRDAHAGHGQQDHQRILHDTHKLHQTHGQHGHGSKHGESHNHLLSQDKHGAASHVREEEAGE